MKHTGDRPVQIGSHYHFFEVNDALEFERPNARGMRLNIPAGTSVRFEPGEEKEVELVEFAGERVILGHKGQRRKMSLSIPRRTYADLYGPTKGDRVRLADTELVIEVEQDFAVYGDEITFGGGKVIRDGMGQSSRATRSEGALDLVITNALIVDHWGIVKGDIGIRDGRIVKVGKAGNPDTMEGVDPELVVGASTEVIAGENLIVTAGAIDSHIHFISPQQIYEALIERHHDYDRRGHRSGDGHRRDHLYSGRLEPGANAGGGRRLADELRVSRQRECRNRRSRWPNRCAPGPAA